MMTVITTGLVFGAYTIAFNIIFGSTGQLFLCVGALAGLGGFGSVILSDRLGIPFVLSIVLAGLLAGAFGALLSWIAVSRSLGTIFTGIVTLAFSLSFENFVLGNSDLTGGDDGLRVMAGSDSILDRQVAPYYVLLGLLGVYLVIYLVIRRSHVGWAFQALRDDEVAAGLAGIDVARYRCTPVSSARSCWVSPVPSSPTTAGSLARPRMRSATSTCGSWSCSPLVGLGR